MKDSSPLGCVMPVIGAGILITIVSAEWLHWLAIAIFVAAMIWLVLTVNKRGG